MLNLKKNSAEVVDIGQKNSLLDFVFENNF